jgi:hypothetical protein
MQTRESFQHNDLRFSVYLKELIIWNQESLTEPILHRFNWTMNRAAKWRDSLPRTPLLDIDKAWLSLAISWANVSFNQTWKRCFQSKLPFSSSFPEKKWEEVSICKWKNLICFSQLGTEHAMLAYSRISFWWSLRLRTAAPVRLFVSLHSTNHLAQRDYCGNLFCSKHTSDEQKCKRWKQILQGEPAFKE